MPIPDIGQSAWHVLGPEILYSHSPFFSSSTATTVNHIKYSISCLKFGQAHLIILNYCLQERFDTYGIFIGKYTQLFSDCCTTNLLVLGQEWYALSIDVLKKTLDCREESYHNVASMGALTLGLCSLSGKTSYYKISWSLEVARFGFRLLIALKFDRHLGSNAAEIPVRFQRETIIITLNLAASRLHEIWR